MADSKSQSPENQKTVEDRFGFILLAIKISAAPQWERAADSIYSDGHAAAVGVAVRRMCLYGLH